MEKILVTVLVLLALGSLLFRCRKSFKAVASGGGCGSGCGCGKGELKKIAKSS